jgi:hypothetical protein
MGRKGASGRHIPMFGLPQAEALVPPKVVHSWLRVLPHSLFRLLRTRTSISFMNMHRNSRKGCIT